MYNNMQCVGNFFSYFQTNLVNDNILIIKIRDVP